MPTDRPPVVVREATASDHAVICAYNQAMAEETEGRQLDGETLSRGVRAVLEDPTKGRYLVAEREGRVVGQLMLTFEWSDWRDGLFWWIQSVYVAPAARKSGVYRALHEHVVALARASGEACGVRLYVEVENDVARATYERLGMRPCRYGMYEQLLTTDSGATDVTPSS